MKHPARVNLNTKTEVEFRETFTNTDLLNVERGGQETSRKSAHEQRDTIKPVLVNAKGKMGEDARPKSGES